MGLYDIIKGKYKVIIPIVILNVKKRLKDARGIYR